MDRARWSLHRASRGTSVTAVTCTRVSRAAYTNYKRLKNQWIALPKTRCSLETAHFAPVPLPGELETYVLSLILAYIRFITWKHDVIYKTGSTFPSEEDLTTATSNVCRKFCEISTSGFWDMRADCRQTDRQHTDTLIAILCTSTRGKVIDRLRIGPRPSTPSMLCMAHRFISHEQSLYCRLQSDVIIAVARPAAGKLSLRPRFYTHL